MKKDFLSQLVDKTFAKLACPTPGMGLYNELKKVITLAFELGKGQDDINERFGSTPASTVSTELTPEARLSGPQSHP
jgi:hypothetical protein